MRLSKLGIEIELKEHFSVVRESLDRIGNSNRDKKILNPICYLLHKRGKYYIIHYKQLRELDGIKTDFNEEEEIKTVSISRLLENWGLIKIINKDEISEINNTFVFVLPFKEKEYWNIIHKYQIGKR